MNKPFSSWLLSINIALISFSDIDQHLSYFRLGGRIINRLVIWRCNSNGRMNTIHVTIFQTEIGHPKDERNDVPYLRSTYHLGRSSQVSYPFLMFSLMLGCCYESGKDTWNRRKSKKRIIQQIDSPRSSYACS